MLTINEVAEQIGIPRGTLSRKLIEFNEQASQRNQILPDDVEDHGHYVKHKFKAAKVKKIKAALASMQDRRRRGRPQQQQPNLQERSPS